MRPALRFTLGFLILLPLAGAVSYFAGYYHVHLPIASHAGFGQTSAQCLAAYGPANITMSSHNIPSPKTRGYVRGGLSIMVGFDEADHAEMFVISKAHLIQKEPFSEAEQKSLLAAYGNGEEWKFSADEGNGPIWQRTDGAYAAYIKNQSWLVLMSKQAMKRYIRALPSR